MSGYDYGNARLRALKSRLLSRSEVEALAESGSPQALINALSKTAYQSAVAAALVRTSGIDCVAQALSRDMVETLGKLRTFYDGREEQMMAILLRAYDVHNLKAILRGLSKQATPDEITAALVPVGEMTLNLMTRLAQAPEPRAAIDMLASMRLPIAQPLLELRVKHPGAGNFEMDLALDQWHLQTAYAYVQRSRRGTHLLAAALDMEADLTNLAIILRFVHSPPERQILYRQLHIEDLCQLFVGPGRLTVALLTKVAEQDSLESAVETLAGTPYAPPLRAGLAAYARSQRLSDFEKQLRRFRLRWMAGLMIRDPLGMGVPLGYLALKTSEVTNIRWIAQGIGLGLEAEAIKAELEFVK